MAKARGKTGSSKPAQPIALTTADWLGNTVILTEESWMHVQGKHGIRDLAVIDKAISTPMRVRDSAVPYHTNAFALETHTDSTSPDHIRVIVHYPEDADVNLGKSIGAAKTAYKVDYSEPSQVGDVIFESPDSTLPDPEKSK